MHSSSREQILHYLPAKKDAFLLAGIEHEVPVRPNPMRQCQEYYQVSIKKSKINYLQSKHKEHDQQHDASINLLENNIQIISPIPINGSTYGSKSPLLIVITPTFNLVKAGRIDHFKQTQKSVCNQTYPNIEHLVIDGGFTDGTLVLLQDMQKRNEIRFISEPEKGIARASGSIIAFLNADDEFLHGDISDLINPIQEGIIDYTKGTAQMIKDGQFIAKQYSDIDTAYMGATCCHQTLFCKTQIMRLLGGFDGTAFPIIADSDLMSKLDALFYRVVCVEGDHAIFRMGGTSDDCVVTVADQYTLLMEKYWPYLLMKVTQNPTTYHRSNDELQRKMIFLKNGFSQKTGQSHHASRQIAAYAV